MSKFGPDILSRFTAALDAMAPGRDADALAAVVNLLGRFPELDLREPLVGAKLPDIKNCPAGSRYRLLVDCESGGDPTYWVEVGSDWQVHSRREQAAPVDLAPGDMVLRPPSSAPAFTASAALAARAHAHPLRLCRAWIKECKAARQSADRAPGFDETHRLFRIEQQLTDVRTLLMLLASVNVTEVERATTIPLYQCGYYNMHLAIDMASPHWSRWVEVRRDGQHLPLGKARGQEYDIFSGHVVLRPAR